MAREVKLKLGFARDTRDATLTIPDDEPTPWGRDSRLALVGNPTSRVDGAPKANGGAKYTYDIDLPGMLHGVILRSPYPHARVRRIDLAAARSLAGVRAVISRDDVVVRFAGQEVAAVAAVSAEIADETLGLIAVEYEELPFVAEMEAALKPDAPKVFASGNLGTPKIFASGNVADGFERAAVTHEAVYTTAVQTHVWLETHGAVASWEGDQLTVWCSTQGIFTVRDDLAVFFNLPAENVRVLTNYLGGGFGSKLGCGPEVVIAAQLAQAAGVAVKLMLPRAAEHIATGNRPNSWQQVKVAANRDGALTAISLVQHGSGGIGGGAGSSGPYRSVYRCPNIRTEERDIYGQQRTLRAYARARMAPGMLCTRAGTRRTRQSAQNRSARVASPQ